MCLGFLLLAFIGFFDIIGYNNRMESDFDNNSEKKKSLNPNLKKAIVFVVEVAKIALIAAVIVIPIRYYLFQPFFVRGQSMDPNFENGDYLIIDEISYRLKEPTRGEVVVFKFPYDISQRFIKRIIGLPGETIEISNGQIKIYKESLEVEILNESEYLDDLMTIGNIKIELSENEYFVMGDNRDFSYDSRKFGAITEDNIIGRVVFRAWPFESLSIFEKPTY